MINTPNPNTEGGSRYINIVFKVILYNINWSRPYTNPILYNQRRFMIRTGQERYIFVQKLIQSQRRSLNFFWIFIFNLNAILYNWETNQPNFSFLFGKIAWTLWNLSHYYHSFWKKSNATCNLQANSNAICLKEVALVRCTMTPHKLYLNHKNVK